MAHRKRKASPPPGPDPEQGGEQGQDQGIASAGTDNEFQLRKLALFVDGPPTFRLGIATCQTPEEEASWLGRLAEDLREGDVALTHLDLSSTPHETDLLARLRDHLGTVPVPAGKRRAVMIVGLAATLDYGTLRPGEEHGLAILHRANRQREVLAHACPGPVVVWLNPTAATLFARSAPDLWHWRSATFHFAGRPGARAEAEFREVARPLIETDRLPASQKRLRIALLRDLLTELESSPEADSPRGKERRAQLHAQMGLAFSAMGEAAQSIGHHERALSLSREIGDQRGEGYALGNLGIAVADLGEVYKAIEYYEKALAIHRETGDRRGQGSALGNLGLAYADLGEVGKAIDYCEQAIEINREIGDRRGQGSALGNLGVAYAHLGEVPKAMEYYEQALAIAREIGDRRGEGNALGNLGLAYAGLGEVPKAIEYCGQALAIASEIGNRRGEGASLGNLGLAYARIGDKTKARELLEQALAIGREIEDPEIVEKASEALARLASGKGGRGSALKR